MCRVGNTAVDAELSIPGRKPRQNTQRGREVASCSDNVHRRRITEGLRSEAGKKAN
jgi:hypothetical protein